MHIRVVTKTGCPYCERAKAALDALGATYEVETIDDESRRRAFYAECGEGVSSVPQIFVDGERLGGYVDLVRKGLPGTA